MGGCSGDNQSWRIVHDLMGDDDVEVALVEAKVWLAAFLVVVLVELVQVDVIVLL